MALLLADGPSLPDTGVYAFKTTAPDRLGGLAEILLRYDLNLSQDGALIKQVEQLSERVGLKLCAKGPDFSRSDAEAVRASRGAFISRRDAFDLVLHWLYGKPLAGLEIPGVGRLLTEHGVTRLAQCIPKSVCDQLLTSSGTHAVQRLLGLHANLDVLTLSSKKKRKELAETSLVPTVCLLALLLWRMGDGGLPGGPLGALWNRVRNYVMDSKTGLSVDHDPCYYTHFSTDLYACVSEARHAFPRILKQDSVPSTFHLPSVAKRCEGIDGISMDEGFYNGRILWCGHRFIPLSPMQAVNLISRDHTVGERNLVCSLLGVDITLFSPVGSRREAELDLDFDNPLDATEPYEAFVLQNLAHFECEFLFFELLDVPRHYVYFFGLYDYSTQSHSTLLLVRRGHLGTLSLLAMLHLQSVRNGFGECWHRVSSESAFVEGEPSEMESDSAEIHQMGSATDSLQPLAPNLAYVVASLHQESSFSLILSKVGQWLHPQTEPNHQTVYSGLTKLLVGLMAQCTKSVQASPLAVLCCAATWTLSGSPLAELSDSQRQSLKTVPLELLKHPTVVENLRACCREGSTLSNVQVLALDLAERGEFSVPLWVRVLGPFMPDKLQRARPAPSQALCLQDPVSSYLLCAVKNLNPQSSRDLCLSVWQMCCHLMEALTVTSESSSSSSFSQPPPLAILRHATGELEVLSAFHFVVVPHLLTGAETVVSPFLRWLLWSDRVVRLCDLEESQTESQSERTAHKRRRLSDSTSRLCDMVSELDVPYDPDNPSL